MDRNQIGLTLLVASASLLGLAGRVSATITMPMVTVGNPGNSNDTTGSGSVGYSYNIGEYDVTVGQYVAFLNAVAKTDTYGLYASVMAPAVIYPLGIQRSGSSGNYSYSVGGTYSQGANCPMYSATWGDVARFCNWLSNGQPNAPEGNGTTETGSYTLNGATSNTALMAITRNSGAVYVIPTENEWYKAAYYDPSLNHGAGGYWLYPTKSNATPSNILSLTGTDNANFYGTPGNGGWTDPTNYLTPVGAFAASPSAYGTFDQGGDVQQWNESSYDASNRLVRGGSFDNAVTSIVSGDFNFYQPNLGSTDIGFRVAQVPEPTSLALLVLGVTGMLIRRNGATK